MRGCLGQSPSAGLAYSKLAPAACSGRPPSCCVLVPKQPPTLTVYWHTNTHTLHAYVQCSLCFSICASVVWSPICVIRLLNAHACSWVFLSTVSSQPSLPFPGICNLSMSEAVLELIAVKGHRPDWLNGSHPFGIQCRSVVSSEMKICTQCQHLFSSLFHSKVMHFSFTIPSGGDSRKVAHKNNQIRVSRLLSMRMIF